MSIYANWATIDRLATTTEQAGGKVPPAVADSLRIRDSIAAWTPPAVIDLADMIQAGQLTPKNCHQVLTDALTRPTLTPADVTAVATAEAARHAYCVVVKHADALIESLQPAHKAAVAKMTKAAEAVDAQTTAEQALQHPDGPAAWTALAQARQILDAIDIIVGLLVNDFEVLGGVEPWMHQRNIRHAAMYCASADSYPGVYQVLATRNGSGGPRGGRWHYAPAELTLQLPSAAAALVDEWRQYDAEQKAAHYAATHGSVPTAAGE